MCARSSYIDEGVNRATGGEDGSGQTDSRGRQTLTPAAARSAASWNAWVEYASRFYCGYSCSVRIYPDASTLMGVFPKGNATASPLRGIYYTVKAKLNVKPNRPGQGG